jgi:hypothetical protein
MRGRVGQQEGWRGHSFCDQRDLSATTLTMHDIGQATTSRRLTSRSLATFVKIHVGHVQIGPVEGVRLLLLVLLEAYTTMWFRSVIIGNTPEQ